MAGVFSSEQEVPRKRVGNVFRLISAAIPGTEFLRGVGGWLGFEFLEYYPRPIDIGWG